MATDTTQFEKQALENAKRELEQAKANFTAQIQGYEAYGNALLDDLGRYFTKRHKWLE